MIICNDKDKYFRK